MELVGKGKGGFGTCVMIDVIVVVFRVDRVSDGRTVEDAELENITVVVL